LPALAMRAIACCELLPRRIVGLCAGAICGRTAAHMARPTGVPYEVIDGFCSRAAHHGGQSGPHL